MTKDKEGIRRAVRERYAEVARKSSAGCGTDSAASCCGPQELSSDSTCCGDQDYSPEQISAALGYSSEDMENIPEGANLGLGCGNPVAIASLKPGETVVDLGSGGGFDCFLAAKEVGESGHVIGVDMTSDMVSKARENASKVGAENVEFRLGEIEHLPIADNTADIIMSNCVINLSPDKPGVYSDSLRVLKPGGRLAISDVLALVALPDEIRNNMALVSACIGGASTIDETKQMLEQAGFQDIIINTNKESREFIRHWAPDSKIEDYVVSAYIEAKKPVA